MVSSDIGDLVDSFPSNYQRIKRLKAAKIPFELAVGLGYVTEKQEILITDPESGKIRVLDNNGNYVREVIPLETLQKPGAMCISDKNEIFIEDIILEKVLIFDKDFNYLRELGDSRIQMSLNMTIDNADYVVYMTSFLNNNLTAWNAQSCEFVNQIYLNSPLSLAVSRDRILVISAVDVGIFSREYTAQISENNNNCVFVIDKKSLEILNSFNISNYIQPKGIIIDADMNFFITAAELQTVNKETISEKKPNRFLVKFNENGEFIQKTSLEIDCTFQVLFFEKKILISRGFRSPPLYLIEFH